MAAMLVLLWLLIPLMKMMMKSDAAEVITAHSGGAVLLTFDLQGLEHRRDVRWTHLHLMVSLKNNATTCHHGRCKLLSDGSLKFSQVQTDDSGNYSLEVFDEEGKRLMKKDFLLRVEEISSSSVTVSVLTSCFLLLLLLPFIIFIIFIILRRRRRSHNPRTAGPLEENVYMSMHGHRGNKRKDEEEKQESAYVPCQRVVSMETPITEQRPEDVEDIYV